MPLVSCKPFKIKFVDGEFYPSTGTLPVTLISNQDSTFIQDSNTTELPISLVDLSIPDATFSPNTTELPITLG